MTKLFLLGALMLSSVSSFAMEKKDFDKCIQKEIQEKIKSTGHYYDAAENTEDDYAPWTAHYSISNILWDIDRSTTSQKYAEDEKHIAEIRTQILSARSCNELYNAADRLHFEYQFKSSVEDTKKGLAANKFFVKEKLGFNLLGDTLTENHYGLNNVINWAASSTTGSKALEARDLLASYKGLTADEAEAAINNRPRGRSPESIKQTYKEFMDKYSTLIFGQSSSSESKTTQKPTSTAK